MCVDVMDDVVLHIGMPKTGTTYLQDCFFPKLEGVNFVGKLDILKKLESGKTNLISDESICGDPFIRGVLDYRCNILSRLKNAYPDARVIFCIRETCHLLRSMYYDYIKQGGVYDYDTFLATVVDHDFFDVSRYMDMIHGVYQDIFVYHYDLFIKDKRRILQRMCDFIGCPMPELFEDVVVNSRWTPRAIAFYKVANRFMKSEYNPCGRFNRRYEILKYYFECINRRKN